MGYCYYVVDRTSKVIHELYKSQYAPHVFAELYETIKGHDFDVIGEDEYCDVYFQKREYESWLLDDTYNRLYVRCREKYGWKDESDKDEYDAVCKEAEELFAEFRDKKRKPS